MTFTDSFAKLVETEAEYEARISAERPALASLPIVTRTGNLRGLAVHLQRLGEPLGITVAVVDEQQDPDRSRLPDGRRKRWGGWFRVVVIASTDPAYPVGGYDLVVSEDEIRRSPRATVGVEPLPKLED